MNRRQVVYSILGSIMANASGSGTGRAAAGAVRGRSQSVGFNLITWEASVLARAKPWRKAIDDIQRLGAGRVTLVPFELIDPAEGRLVPKSRFELTRGPNSEVIRDIVAHARQKQLSVSLKPMIEIDNQVGEGDQWRGNLSVRDGKLGPFFESYRDYILGLVRIAREEEVSRFYIGSELTKLVKNPHSHPYWQQLIKDCRAELGSSTCLLTYAANYNEYDKVPFWADLDEIGIDAYFALADDEQAAGPGRPGKDELKVAVLKMMHHLKTFSESQGRPIMLAEWGVVPLDKTTVEPSEPEPSDVEDSEEALNAYWATLEALSEQSDWLQGIDFWHWKVGTHEDSNYRIEPNGPIAKIVRWWIAN